MRRPRSCEFAKSGRKCYNYGDVVNREKSANWKPFQRGVFGRESEQKAAEDFRRFTGVWLARDNTPITDADAKRMSEEGYRWSGHTHPGRGEVVRIASPADKVILQTFGQRNSVIYDGSGNYKQFGDDFK
jgi:hypothetical protein